MIEVHIETFIDHLLDSVDIVALVNSYVPLKKKVGRNYYACCPFHKETTPSFSVSGTKQFFYCFGCGAHGNAIDFMMQIKDISFMQAIEHLNNGKINIIKEIKMAWLHDLLAKLRKDFDNIGNTAKTHGEAKQAVAQVLQSHVDAIQTQPTAEVANENTVQEAPKPLQGE